MDNKNKNKEQRQQKSSLPKTTSFRRYLPVAIFIVLTIIAVQTPLLELTEQKLSTHMIIEHLLFFLIGALSVISAERILQLLYIRYRQNLLTLGQTSELENSDNNHYQRHRPLANSYKALLWWGNLLRSIFSFDRTGILWISIALILMALWHYPPIFDTAAINPNVHIIQHFSFIIVGAAGYLAIRVCGESFRIFLLVALIGMMGFAGLLFSVLDAPIYLVYPVWQHNEAGFYMVIASALLLIIALPTYLIRRTLNYVKVTRGIDG